MASHLQWSRLNALKAGRRTNNLGPLHLNHHTFFLSSSFVQSHHFGKLIHQIQSRWTSVKPQNVHSSTSWALSVPRRASSPPLPPNGIINSIHRGDNRTKDNHQEVAYSLSQFHTPSCRYPHQPRTCKCFATHLGEDRFKLSRGVFPSIPEYPTRTRHKRLLELLLSMLMSF